MPIVEGSLLEFAVRMQGPAGQVMNVYQFAIEGQAADPDVTDIAEAFWNHISAEYRALVWVGFGNVFRDVLVRELEDPQGAYGVYSIPIAQQVGNRSNLSAPIEPMPPFSSCGVRLTVGSRVTRPGQKRLGWLVEADNQNGILQEPYVSLASDLMNKLTGPILLGAPAALTSLTLMVVSKDTRGAPVASQRVTGYNINTFITTQNTRKYGRGS